jgi:oxygen-independent coproporphyrinogen III oxidase
LANPEFPVSLYVHVPFCADKCLYCDFYSVPRQSVAERAQHGVVERTIRQLQAFYDAAASGPATRSLGGSGSGVSAAGARRAKGDAATMPSGIETIYVGGGTPSTLRPEDFSALLGALEGTGCSEWTVEANPESLDAGFLQRCKAAGVTRLSVGIQTLRDDKLRLLRRPATRSQTLAALDLLGKEWPGELNLDFIAGIPGQTVQEVEEDLSELTSRQPRHFSLYQLTCEPGTLLDRLVKQGKVRLNAPEKDEELWFAGSDFLQRKGYQHYEVSNFALPGMESRHNVRYWHMEPYFGAGPGAVSTIPGSLAARVLRKPELSEAAVVRLSNPRRLTPSEPEIEVVNARDFLLENLMMGLRIAEGVPVQQLKGRFGRAFQELFPGLWERWVDDGTAVPAGTHLRLTPRGMLILDTLLGQVAEQVSRDDLPSLELLWPY